MRRKVRVVMSGLSVAVVAFGLRESTVTQQPPGSAAPAGIVAGATRTVGPTSRPGGTATTRPRPAAARPPARVMVNGAPIDTAYGPVQVQIVVRNGRIVRADAIDYPQGGGMDQAINSQAIPLLDQETLQAQTARIDSVSGATYTSDGYIQSLQSALDAAHSR